MILLIDTSAGVCKLSIIYNNQSYDDEWQAEKTLARGLLRRINQLLSEHHKSWTDIKAIGVFEGPGSFTGIRIGLTVMNTIANTEEIPIVGGRGDRWRDEVLNKLQANKDEKIVLPFYGSDAKITTSKK